MFLQVTDTPTTDIDVPGMGFSFGKLIGAQADGDLLALRDGRTQPVATGFARLDRRKSNAGVG